MAINTDGAMIGKAGIQIHSKSEYKRVTTLMQDEIERLRTENEKLIAINSELHIELGRLQGKLDMLGGNIATTDAEGE